MGAMRVSVVGIMRRIIFGAFLRKAGIYASYVIRTVQGHISDEQRNAR